MSSAFLLPQNDDLPMRDSQDYAKDKLSILEGYIYRFTTSMRTKNWRALFYIDLLAGPGKNFLNPSKTIMLGSPLIALTAKYPFTHYRYIESDASNYDALQQRCSVSEIYDRVKVMHGDCNVLVNDIVHEIQTLDRKFIQNKWPSLSLAFIDPEGLEVHWETVEQLGQVGRMDLIVNFSTSGLTRNVSQMMKSKEETSLDRFFGTSQWRDVYHEMSGKDSTHIRRTMLDFYKQRLATLDYLFNLERDIVPDEKIFRTQKNVQIYTLMFASKHELGIEFWTGAIKEVDQPKLL